MNEMNTEVFEDTAPADAAGMPRAAASDEETAAVETDPAMIMAALRDEMKRVCVAEDTACICIVSPDGAAGDSAMAALGEMIAANLRSNDALYRFADDKFLLVLRQTDRDGAVGFIKRLRDEMLSRPQPDRDGAPATASYGGTIMDPRAPLHEHMDRASEAHSWALKGGRDTICMWTPKF